MATFPILSTGAITQYPLSKGTSFLVDVVRFLDGTDQRCLSRGKRLRRWAIQLSKLTEPELAALRTVLRTEPRKLRSISTFWILSRGRRFQTADWRSNNRDRISSPGNGSTSFSIVENHA